MSEIMDNDVNRAFQEALSGDELWAAAMRQKTTRAERLPDEAACFRAISDAVIRLRDLGWRDACYCPKDGTVFDAIHAGDLQSHPCNYMGEWPDGSYWTHDAGDLWPGTPIMFKLRPDDEAALQARLRAAGEAYAAEEERRQREGYYSEPKAQDAEPAQPTPADAGEDR